MIFGPAELEPVCRAVGLPLATIKNHEACIKESMAGRKPRVFKIADACRRENNGIVVIDSKLFEYLGDQQLKAVAFVPSAGAASRFLEPLRPVAIALMEGDALRAADLAEAIDSDVKTRAGGASFPLPSLLRKFIDTKGRDFSANDLLMLLEILSWPKALFPCNPDGVTFFEAKLREHAAYRRAGSNFCGEVYVVPPGLAPRFEKLLAAFNAGAEDPLPYEILEQDASLSTLRFTQEGAILIAQDGKPALVPAGHGALIKLFSKVQKTFPDADYLLIRNVDNVCGISDEASEEVLRFSSFASAVIKAVRVVRASLRERDLSGRLLHEAIQFFSKLKFKKESEGALNLDTDGAVLRALEYIQQTVFHSVDEVESGSNIMTEGPVERLIRLFDRPLNILGQVPNSGNDIGGTPVFVQRADGRQEKLCIEVAHVGREQVELILKDPFVATHFNPVFVASELGCECSGYASSHPFWSCVQKRFEGNDVFHFESFLYEILGSSSLSNVVFVEIPRLLFNPHKTLQDAASTVVQL